MKKNIQIICLLFMLFLCNGCSIIEAFESSKVKRYRKAEFKGKSAKALVDVDLFGSKISKSKISNDIVSLWSLSDRGQASLIEALDRRAEKKNTEFVKSIENKYFVQKQKGIITDYTIKNIKMIFSISKLRRYEDFNIANNKNGTGYSIGDRIEYLKFSLDLPAKSVPSLNFNSWNKFESEYKTINIADISFNKTFSFTGGIGNSNTKSSEKNYSQDDIVHNDSSGTSISPSINFNSTNAYTENQSLNNRYLSLNGKLTDKKIIIEQEGHRAIDLSGNVIVDVSLKFDHEFLKVCHVMDLYDKKAKPNSNEKIKFKLISVKVPNFNKIPEVIEATLKYNYVYRHITNKEGKKTFFEWDDHVNYYSGTGEKTISLFKLKDYVPEITRLGYFRNEKFIDIKILEKYRKNSNEDEFLVFQNYDKSNDFLNWLILFSSNTKYEIDKINKERKPGYNSKLSELKNDYEKQIEIGNYLLVTSDKEKISKKFIVENINNIFSYFYYK